MILAIDLGNSTFTSGLFDASGKLIFVSTLETNPNKTSDQCAIDLLNLFHLNGLTPDCVQGAILSSVVPPITANVVTAIQKLAGISAMVIGPGIKTGLNIKTEIHTQLGSRHRNLICCCLEKI
jgi:type III pantothenate kinase